MSEFPKFPDSELGPEATKNLRRLSAVDDPEVMGAAENMFASRSGSDTEKQEGEQYFIQVLFDRGYVSNSDSDAALAVGSIEAACRRRLEEENPGQ